MKGCDCRITIQKQWQVLEKETEKLKSNPGIRSIVLIGSVAYGEATEDSDLDLLVLCDRDKFVSKMVDEVLVEAHFHQYETLENRLRSSAAEVYKYLYSKILLDDGSFAKLAAIANEVYKNYRTSEKDLANIRYWLSSTKAKLLAKQKQNDTLGMAYLLSTNTWKVLEGVYAINHIPMPPSSLAFYLRDTLRVPLEGWFETLLMGEMPSRVEMMLKLIELICQ